MRAPTPVSCYPTPSPSPANEYHGPSSSSFRQSFSSQDHNPCPAERSHFLNTYLAAPTAAFQTPSQLLVPIHLHSRDIDGLNEDAFTSTLVHFAGHPSFSRSKTQNSVTEGLNQRKAYFRAVSDNVGFDITDPDTITSHDKKRCYLECLEEYVQWLHEQFRLVGQVPPPLERVSTYRGLKSRSIRTMLVHKQGVVSKLNRQKVQEVQKFMAMQEEFLQSRKGL
ncbi:hypothetical protein C8Q78DRAFT_1074632 [Trametes maxima]|nr:hypothetical protein C8Q78DRAFT_1074632 [Trametes maxima]